MKFNPGTVFDILAPLRDYFQKDSVIRNYNEEPFRSELFSSDQMNRHGKLLASSHKLQKKNTQDQLLKRLYDNEKTLLEVRNLLVENLKLRKTISPGAEWLLDNFYLIEEQIVIARKHLPKGYSQGLPYLENGVSAGMPRVYDIVLEIISHSDGRVDVRSLSKFIESYQTNTILTLGELWAIPIMLRLAVIENLRRVAVKIALDMIDNNLAEYWADKMLATVEEDPGNLILTIADMVRSKPVLESPFVAGFTRKLQGKGPALVLPLNWMEQQLANSGNSSTDLVRQENQKQAIDQVSVSNSIGTLRFIGATDWRDFVEQLSSVEKILRQDISGVYPLMDFATRDKYRHVVESISKSSRFSETEVALKALELSAKYKEENPTSFRHQHIGYYLIDKGVKLTEKISARKYTLKESLVRLCKKMPVFLYVFSITAITLAVSAGLVYFAYANDVKDRRILTALGLLSMAGTSQLAVSMVNWLATILVKPFLLPRMDFSKGIPDEYRTIVAIPTMLVSKSYIEDLVEALEIRFLANKEDNLHFALVTDYLDADKEVMPPDDELIEIAKSSINALNQKYKREGSDIFFLFHRPRKWNERERKWMGYERKRGKLSSLNCLIQGKEHEFSVVVGKFPTEKIKYVITLDSDTQLPRDAAWKFIATMAHPLNQPIYNEQERRVTEGYGILQPRVATCIPKAMPTPYLRMQGSVVGIDPYTRVSSDVYQDVFGEGSFIGKGIYEVEVFEKTLHGVLPENRILSHDLLEGCYTRSGLLSDVLLYEDNPSQYSTDIKRFHRWIRGDWQIGSWILPFITGSNGRLTKNKLSGLSRWKIFDNLRRSMIPASLLLLLLMGWTALPYAWFWTLAVTVIILMAAITAAGWQLINKPEDLSFKAHFNEVGISVRDVLIRFTFGIAVLPYEAYLFTDAIIRTNWRMAISHRKLLEWTPSAIASTSSNTMWAAYKTMWVVPLVGLVSCAYFFHYNPQVMGVAFPIIFLWILAPAISWRLGLPEVEKSTELDEEQTLFLHKTARKTWAFFEQFVTEKENWLPPDNYQEQPVAVIAHRTSPTNMGMALLANLSAYDFGYISGGELLSRCYGTLDTMNKLERFKGHFYNWYDTLSLMPLHPRYVSTVDSGNLVGHLLTLRQGLLTLNAQPIISYKIYEGFTTTATIMLSYSKGNDTDKIRQILNYLNNINSGKQENLLSIHKNNLETLTTSVNQLLLFQGNRTTDLYKWTVRLLMQIKSFQDDLLQTAPWIELLPVPEKYSDLIAIDHVPSLGGIAKMSDRFLESINILINNKGGAEDEEWLTKLHESIVKADVVANEKRTLLEELSDWCEEFSVIEYDFLYNKSTSLLRIGYNVDEQRKDESYYDLLASEARLGIFVGIAQGKLPQECWFALGRLLTDTSGDPILLSWSGSMFEYLMPELVMPSYENTLLYQTNKATVHRQIEYGSQRGVPWGISESGYNMVDANMNYQYRAFGVPGLGLKRGLEEDLVIAPYASMLALMVAPTDACANLELLSIEGFEGEFGFYEAIDYTTSRLSRGKSNSIVNSYMAHHQGMGFLSLSYLLLNKPMQRRFESELRFQATLLLLQERIPRATLFYAHTSDILETRTTIADVPLRRITTPNTKIPELQLLSNGRYQVMITNSGGGYSRWKGMAVTRWREDMTKDDRGMFCYIKDVNSGNFWSNTYQPTHHPAKNYETIFSQGHVEFRRQDYGINTHTEIVISQEDDTEMRRIKLTNRNLTAKTIEITSYAEIVMASHASDESHPAFSNLFVQTEILPEHKAVFCTRRPRSEEETPPWMFHMMDISGAVVEAVSYETDRMQFIGRGKTLAHPQAMDKDALSGKQGSVLDPIMAIRYRITLKPGQTATIDLIYGISETKEICESLMHKYRDQHLKKRAFELSWTHNQVLLRQINATEVDAQLYDRLAASIIYANTDLRADSTVIYSNYRGQSGLWSHSVSGDLPIVIVHIHNTQSLELVKQMVQAHAYWRLKGLAVDLVIWNEDHGSYRQVLQEQLMGLINSEANSSSATTYSKPGGIFVKSADQISPEDRILFESVARVIIHDNRGSLSEQVNRHFSEKVFSPLLDKKPSVYNDIDDTISLPKDLVFYNGTGGFASDGKEYKILIDKKTTTPAPWVNIIANPNFGSVVSESGSAYTWAINAHEYRITPWSNDPVSDVGGEAFYLRDEENAHFWSPSPFPRAGNSPYIVTHGFGYSTYEHSEQGIFTEMSVFVDKDQPVKFVVIKIKNRSGKERKLSATGFLELILGDIRSKTNMHILPEYDSNTGTLLFRNRYNSAFADRVAFFRVDGVLGSFTTDRTEFIGRNGNLQNPIALHRRKLSGRTEAGMDSCAALQVKFDLKDGGEKEIVFQIGNEENIQAANALIRKYTDTTLVMQSLQEVKEYWQEVIGAVQVETPDTALNILANGWLTYQTMACRVFARSGFYQSGGAFGFRDQLQDVLALIHTRPELARQQILLSASRQFVEGDVQHWWHPPEGRGVRTKCSDDMLWLPFVTAKYLAATGDTDILTLQIGFLESRRLTEHEESIYDLPVSGNLTGTLYGHCVGAIKHSLRFGVHGLPFIGSGDWNDGMDLVGRKGQGESVWLAFFLYDVLMNFAEVASGYGDVVFAETCKKDAATLQANIEASSWDGEWYKRAYFDDGVPLGSKDNNECRIDAIAQSWGVLSGAADHKRRLTAMESLDKYLVRRDLKLIQLLDPPFNTDGLNPGYIKGYVPGVRENGGQYSHAAIWALMAFAALGQREKTWELFSMVNPLNHASNASDVSVYKVEPYVMAADVYANESHKGRGGWTWYTGSSGWMYQFITSSLLGLKLEKDQLKFKPCFPKEWPYATITYRFGKSTYKIKVYQTTSNSSWKDGKLEGKGDSIKLVDDGNIHEAEVHVNIKE